jgi:hypothetical protein
MRVNLHRAVEPVQIHDRRVARPRRSLEHIAEAAANSPLGCHVHPGGQAGAAVEHDHAQIVDAMHMVGMVMGEDHRVQNADTGADQLLAHIGPGIDQHIGNSVLP